VRALFDDFAPTFNAQLQGGLQYVVPALVGEAVGRLVSAERRGVRFASALDAGCGTGLLGPQLRAHVSGQLAGVDLSPKMVRFAAALPAIYDVLKVGDLLALGNLDSGLSPGYSPGLAQPPSGLAGLPGPFELVAAGDVLVYFGQLEDLLQAFRRVLSPGSKARVVFSVEALEEVTWPKSQSSVAALNAAANGWALTPSGRYAHSAAYVANAAASAGLRVLAHSRIVPRVEKGKEVRGHLFVLGR